MFLLGYTSARLVIEKGLEQAKGEVELNQHEVTGAGRLGIGTSPISLLGHASLQVTRAKEREGGWEGYRASLAVRSSRRATGAPGSSIPGLVPHCSACLSLMAPFGQHGLQAPN